MKACMTLLMLLSLTACDLRIEDPTDIKNRLDKCSSIGMTSSLVLLGNNSYSIKCV